MPDFLTFERHPETGEPIFKLRAQDYSAATFVRKWAHFNRDTISPAKYDQAMAIADEMERWPNRKFPD